MELGALHPSRRTNLREATGESEAVFVPTEFEIGTNVYDTKSDSLYIPLEQTILKSGLKNVRSTRCI